jgi:predicted ATPase/class 3 adenylate cyclase
MPDLPSGTVTFLFTDIEGSTALWERDREAMAAAVARHLALLRGAIEEHHGTLYKTVGDGTQSAFSAARDALAAALTAQRTLGSERWPDPPGPLRVRMALHTGEAHPQNDDYLAGPLNRLARLLGMAQGSQILLTEAVEQLAQDDLPSGASLRDLGEVRLRDLERPERVFALAHPDLLNNLRLLKSETGRVRHFPTSLTPFLGRETEIAAVTHVVCVPNVRLVTLTGPGGIGKTRIALEVGERVASDFADGAVFVDLASLREVDLVLPAIATSLGLREAAGRPLDEVVQGYLVERQILLLLDNFEHLLDAATIVSDLLVASPHVKALVTSRGPLRVRGEREYPVPTLHMPSAHEVSDPASLAGNEAVALFVDRAQAVRPDFTLTDENTRAVTEICLRLDGLPLAIELAAARAKVLPPAALLSRLEQRLPLLTGGTRDAPERQRTLRDAIGWSHDLLTPVEGRLFRYLAVFVGGWTLDAAESVANLDGDLDVLDGLTSLVDKSLMRLDESALEPRYGMLETIREFALEHLAASDDADRVQDAHAHYITRIAQEFDQSMFTARWREWQVRLDAEIPNLRTALVWLDRCGHTEALLILASSSWWALWQRGHMRDAREWLERGLAAPGPVSPEIRAWALGIAANCAWNQGDNKAAERLAHAGADLSLTEGFDVAAGMALYTLMLVGMERGTLAHAIIKGEEAIRHFRRSGSNGFLSQALVDAGLCVSMAGDRERAATLREEGFVLCREIGNTWGLAVGLSDLGAEAEERGDGQTALEHYRDSLRLLIDNPYEAYVAHPLAGMASRAAAVEQIDLAARLLGTVAFLHETHGTMAQSHERKRDDRTETLARAALGEARFNQEVAVGRRLSISEAVRQALDAVWESSSDFCDPAQ